MAAGKSVFSLIYQTCRLASYYLDYSLTSAAQLCEAGLFTTCLGKVSQGCEEQEDRIVAKNLQVTDKEMYLNFK